jgi:hypothetical protein
MSDINRKELNDIMNKAAIINRLAAIICEAMTASPESYNKNSYGELQKTLDALEARLKNMALEDNP